MGMGRYGWLVVVVVGGKGDKQGGGRVSGFSLTSCPPPPPPYPIIPPLGTHRRTHNLPFTNPDHNHSFLTLRSRQA